MKILLTGGGTGGHITPILAVAHEIKLLDPKAQVIYVGEKGGKFKDLTDKNPDIDHVYTIRAGKLRRYHGDSALKKLFDVKTNALNLRDSLYVSIGLPQAGRLLSKIKPDVVFLKGGYVGVPIGLAAAMKHIPIVTHDSDAVPGLANRLVSRWASIHATALPAEVYDYPQHKVKPIGVLVEHNYQLVDYETQKAFKQQIGVPTDKPMLLITGASSGAQSINEAIRDGIEELLAKEPDLHVVHQVGKGKTGVYQGFSHSRLQVFEFLKPMHVYMGAADLVVARASGNTVAELGVQGKPVVVVPSPFLAGGHQLKNAEILAGQGAAAVVYEDKMYDLQQGLLPTISALLHDAARRELLAKNLNKQIIPDAAKQLAVLLLEQADKTVKTKK